MRWPSLPALVLILTAGCGGSGNPPDSTKPPGGSGESITGRERLGWNQSAADSAELASFRYGVYIDNANRVLLADVSCSPSGATFQCSSRMPSMSAGSHRIELVTIVMRDGQEVESTRSAALMVTMSGATAPADTDAAPSLDRDVATSDGIRLRLSTIDTLEMPTAMAFASPEQAYVAERGGRIQILDPRSLRASERRVAIELPDVAMTGAQHGGLLDLALDPAFDRTRFVYALYTTPASEGLAFRVARFRDAGGRLGERAILLDGIAAAPDRPAASIAFGPDGLLYLAFDDGGDPDRARRTQYSGKLLRLNADGTTPTDQRTAGPVYSAPYRSPRGFDWRPDTQALWVVDEIAEGVQELRIVTRDSPRHILPTTRAYALPPATGASSMTFYRGELLAGFTSDLLVGASDAQALLRVRFDRRDPNRVAGTERLLEDLGAPVRFVAVAPDGAVHVGTDRGLFRLGPR